MRRNVPLAVALAGAPAPWMDAAAAALTEAGFAPLICDDPAADFTQRTDTPVALILVDTGRADWRSWVVRVKTEQATRRIPVVAVLADPGLHAVARSAGADDAIRPGDLGAWLLPFVRDLAEKHAARFEQLDCQCGEPLPPRARQGVEKFNAGEYYAQHDLFEAQWMAETGPVRDLYRAILQVGVAYYHITHGRLRGARRMLLRSAQWLAVLPDECQGIDVRQLREDAARVQAALQTVDPGDPGAFDRALLRPIHLTRQD